METSRMVIDSTLFIEHLRAKEKFATTLSHIPDTETLCLSTVTIYELYMGATTDQKRNDIEILTGELIVLPFDEEASLEASRIYHQLKMQGMMIEFRDIFIAATAIVNNQELKSLNRKHFERIANLRLA